MPRKSPPTYRLTRDFIIPAGSEVFPPPTKSTSWGKHHEVIVGIDRDHTAYLSLDLQDGIDTGLVEQVPGKPK